MDMQCWCVFVTEKERGRERHGVRENMENIVQSPVDSLNTEPSSPVNQRFIVVKQKVKLYMFMLLKAVKTDEEITRHDVWKVCFLTHL